MTTYRITWMDCGARKSITVHTLRTAQQLVETLDSQGAYDVVLTTKQKTFSEVVITFDSHGPRKL